jgi:hypothetical protein
MSWKENVCRVVCPPVTVDSHVTWRGMVGLVGLVGRVVSTGGGIDCVWICHPQKRSRGR